MRAPATAAALVLSAALAAPPAAARDFVASNTLTVVATGPGSFVVRFGGLEAEGDFWCAAGEYVIRRLGLPSATRVYRTSPPPRRAAGSVSFSLDRTQAVPSGITTFGAPDEGMTAGGATAFCEPPEFYKFF
jgi:hypothetical protein